MRKITLCIVVLGVLVIILSFTGSNDPANKTSSDKLGEVSEDSVASVKAFMSVYSVVMHPRCMNCHPSGDSPLQGDDSHLHAMGVKRGIDGKGLTAAKCSNCHQSENSPGLHAPPGNPRWSMTPLHMRMVFQGKGPHELAILLLDTKQNGGRSKEDIFEHMTKDDLVGWAWNPGEGRTMPPLTRPQFAEQVKLWLEKGGFAPPTSK